MKSTKKFISAALLPLFILIIGIYLTACTSADTTTGKLAFQQKDYAKAEVELKKGLQIDQNDAEGWYMLGVSQMELGKYDDGGKSFQKSLAINSNYGSNIQQYYVDKFNSGINNYNSAIKLKDTDSSGAANVFNKALNDFIAASNTMPDSIAAFQLLGDTYIQLGESQKALDVYSGIIDRSQSKDDALRIASILYESGVNNMKAKNYEDAKGIFDKIINLNYLPKDSEYYEVSVYNHALADYKIAEALVSENSGADYKPYMNDVILILEPMTSTSKNNKLLVDVYDLLIVAYDALGQSDKAEDARTRQAALGQ